MLRSAVPIIRVTNAQSISGQGMRRIGAPARDLRSRAVLPRGAEQLRGGLVERLTPNLLKSYATCPRSMFRPTLRSGDRVSTSKDAGFSRCEHRAMPGPPSRQVVVLQAESKVGAEGPASLFSILVGQGRTAESQT